MTVKARTVLATGGVCGACPAPLGFEVDPQPQATTGLGLQVTHGALFSTERTRFLEIPEASLGPGPAIGAVYQTGESVQGLGKVFPGTNFDRNGHGRAS